MQLDPSKFVAEGLTYDDVLLLPLIQKYYRAKLTPVLF
jgi:IMP dehydrogenase/GMP reductase